MSKLIIETTNQAQLLTLNRPETKNAFEAVLWSLFRDALNDARQDPEIYSVIVTGSGNTFSTSGAAYALKSFTIGAGTCVLAY